MYYTYILRCSDKSLYTGITTDVSRRFSEHKKGKGAKYTLSKTPEIIEAVFMSENRSLASKLEYYIKKLSKLDKEKLIKTKNLSEFLSIKADVSLYKAVDF